MGKWVAGDVLDAALQTIASADAMIAMAGQPVDFAAAMSGRLAGAAMAPPDFSLGAGAGDGRRIGVATKSGVAVTADGVADHIALVDTGGERLLYVTTCPPRPLAAGGSVSFDAWHVEIGAPA
jgi:hypothetical protein